MITSVQNPRVKAARKLHEPKGRKAAERFLLEGTALLAEALAAGWPLDEVFATAGVALPGLAEGSEALAAPGAPASRRPPEATLVSDHVLSALSTLKTPEGVVAVGRIPPVRPLPSVTPGSLWLVADAIADPANLGAMIRTADAAGAEAVVLGPGSTDPWGPRAVRASMGSVLHLPIVAARDLAQAKQPGMRWLALVPRAPRSLYETDLTSATAILVGNEAAGLSRDALALADEAIAIPMPGRTESLNAAAAVAVVLFEAARQRAARQPAQARQVGPVQEA